MKQAVEQQRSARPQRHRDLPRHLHARIAQLPIPDGVVRSGAFPVRAWDHVHAAVVQLRRIQRNPDADDGPVPCQRSVGQRPAAESGEDGLPKKRAKAIRQVIQTIHETGGHRVTHRELAERAGLSTAYLSRTFKQCEGLSLKSYMSRVRLERARELLSESTMNISCGAPSMPGPTGGNKGRRPPASVNRQAVQHLT